MDSHSGMHLSETARDVKHRRCAVVINRMIYFTRQGRNTHQERWAILCAKNTMRFGIVRPIAKIKVQFFASQCISSDSYKQQQSYNTMYCIVHVIHVHCALFFTKYISWADPEGGQGSGLSLFTLIHMCIFPCSVRISGIVFSFRFQNSSRATLLGQIAWTARLLMNDFFKAISMCTKVSKY